CHMEKFFDREHHLGQWGFFISLEAAWASRWWGEVTEGFDEDWRRDLDHVGSDMNGSAIFLFAALKMKLKMATRRHVARSRGTPLRVSGPLDEREDAVFRNRMEALLLAFGLPEAESAAGRSVSTKRDAPGDALRLLRHLEEVPGKTTSRDDGARSF